MHSLRSSQLARFFGQCRQSDAVVQAGSAADRRTDHRRRADLREGQLEATALLGRALGKDEFWLRLLQVARVVVQVRRSSTGNIGLLGCWRACNQDNNIPDSG